MRTPLDHGMSGFYWGIALAFVVCLFADADTARWAFFAIMATVMVARGGMELGKRGLIGTPDAATSPQEDER